METIFKALQNSAMVRSVWRNTDGSLGFIHRDGLADEYLVEAPVDLGLWNVLLIEGGVCTRTHKFHLASHIIREFTN